jgi:hypothetical protein
MSSVNIPTTWMLRNIHYEHNAFTLHALLSTMVDGTSYNLLFLPWVWNKDKNAGFAFVNFLTGEGAAKAIESLRGKFWPDSRQKEIEVRPAVVQGFEANVSARRRTPNTMRTLLLLDNGKQICEEIALSLYGSRQFAEAFMLQGQQDETEGDSDEIRGGRGDSSSSRSDSLQDTIRSFGVPTPEPKVIDGAWRSTQPGASPISRLSPKDLMNTHLQVEANHFARKLESAMYPLDRTEASFMTTPSPDSMGSRSASSHSCTTTAAAPESYSGYGPASPTSLARQVLPESPTAFGMGRNGGGWAMPARTPPSVSMMETTPSRTRATPSSDALEYSMTMQDLEFKVFGSSSGRQLPSRNLSGTIACYGEPTRLPAGTIWSF